MWNKETLLKGQTMTVNIGGDSVVIRKLKTCEVMNKAGGEDKSIALVAASLVDPALTIDEVKEIPIETVNALLPEILKFNGMDKDAKQGN